MKIKIALHTHTHNIVNDLKKKKKTEETARGKE